MHYFLPFEEKLQQSAVRKLLSLFEHDGMFVNVFLKIYVYSRNQWALALGATDRKSNSIERRTLSPCGIASLNFCLQTTEKMVMVNNKFKVLLYFSHVLRCSVAPSMLANVETSKTAI